MQIENADGGRSTVTGSQVPLERRIEWLIDARNDMFSDHVTQSDLDKYLGRGLVKMPWTEMSQAEFLQYVVSFPVGLPKLIPDEVMLKVSVELMDQVVRDPERLYRSAFKVLHNKGYRNMTVSANKENTQFHQLTSAPTGSKNKSSAADKINSLFTRRNSGSKCSTSGNESPSTPKSILCRNSRPGSVKSKVTPVLRRKCYEDNTNGTITEDKSISSITNDTNSLPNSRPNSLIIQVPVN